MENKENFQDVFNFVLAKVKEGVTISRALKMKKYNSYDFYNNISGAKKKRIIA